MNEPDSGGLPSESGVPTRVLFVCLGNICRSPSAEAVMRHRLRTAGLEGAVEVDSAGTGDWHVGKAADPRAIEAARARGIEMTGVARQVSSGDFTAFDLVIAMDVANRDNLLARPEADPERVRLMREFEGLPGAEVPDPYFGEEDGFEQVLDILERSCDGLIEALTGRG